MTRATRDRVTQRLKRKGQKGTYDAGYAHGWAQGRTELADALASPDGFVATDGSVFRLLKITPPAPEPPAPASTTSEDRGPGT